MDDLRHSRPRLDPGIFLLHGPSLRNMEGKADHLSMQHPKMQKKGLNGFPFLAL